jgi:penicillin-binding protein 1A
MPAWQQALQDLRLPLYDVHWTPAVIVQKGDSKKGDNTLRVGLPDGRILPLTGVNFDARRGLGLYDVVYVNATGAAYTAPQPPAVDPRTGKPIKQKTPVSVGQAQLAGAPDGARARRWCWRTRPAVSSPWRAAFSYPLSQLNRTSQTQRQPGSAIKPITYLTALQKGLQPNTLVAEPADHVAADRQ